MIDLEHYCIPVTREIVLHLGKLQMYDDNSDVILCKSNIRQIVLQQEMQLRWQGGLAHPWIRRPHLG